MLKGELGSHKGGGWTWEGRNAVKPLVKVPVTSIPTAVLVPVNQWELDYKGGWTPTQAWVIGSLGNWITTWEN